MTPTTELQLIQQYILMNIRRREHFAGQTLAQEKRRPMAPRGTPSRYKAVEGKRGAAKRAARLRAAYAILNGGTIQSHVPPDRVWNLSGAEA
jgi:hypothetical protein